MSCSFNIFSLGPGELPTKTQVFSIISPLSYWNTDLSSTWPLVPSDMFLRRLKSCKISCCSYGKNLLNNRFFTNTGKFHTNLSNILPHLFFCGCICEYMRSRNKTLTIHVKAYTEAICRESKQIWQFFHKSYIDQIRFSVV